MSFEDVTFSRSVTDNSGSNTVTDKISHPIAHFLGTLGLDVSQFPRVSILIETKEHILKNTQTYITLRVPGESTLLYESAARVKRIVEIPSADLGEHKKFIEVEWYIDEQGILEEENHPGFAFLSNEIQCPKCKGLFVPDASLKDEQRLELTCPSCLMRWELSVDSRFLSHPQPKMLSDAFAQDPQQVTHLIKTWQKPVSVDEETRSEFFLSEFVRASQGSSLEMFFGEKEIFVQHSTSCEGDFELLWRSFVNSLMEIHLRLESSSAARLEQTEVFRKSEVSMRNEQTVTPALFPKARYETGPSREAFAGAFEAEFGAFKTTTDVRSLEDLQREIEDQQQSKNLGFEKTDHPPLFSHATQMQRPKSFEPAKRPWALMLSLAASTFLFALLSLFFFLQSKSSESGETSSLAALTPPSFEISRSETSVQRTSEESISDTLRIEDSGLRASPSRELESRERLESQKEVVKQEVDIQSEPPASAASESLASEVVPEETAETQAPSREVERELERQAQRERARQEQRRLVADAYEQGIQLFNREEYQMAIQQFRRVVDIDPQHAEGHRNLGLAYVYSEQYDEGRHTLETYLRLAGPQADTEIQTHVRQVLSFIDSWSAQ